MKKNSVMNVKVNGKKCKTGDIRLTVNVIDGIADIRLYSDEKGFGGFSENSSVKVTMEITDNEKLTDLACNEKAETISDEPNPEMCIMCQEPEKGNCQCVIERALSKETSELFNNMEEGIYLMRNELKGEKDTDIVETALGILNGMLEEVKVNFYVLLKKNYSQVKKINALENKNSI